MSGYPVTFVRHDLSIDDDWLAQMSGKAVAFLVSIRADSIGECHRNRRAAGHSFGRATPWSFHRSVVAIGGPDLVSAGFGVGCRSIYDRGVICSVVFGRPACAFFRRAISRAR